MNISQWVKGHAIRSPEKVALRTDEQVLTYEQFEMQIESVACGLKWQFGVAAGDRVAFLAHNCAEFLTTLFACARIGAIFVPLNWRLTEPELLYILQNAEVKLLVLQEAFAPVIGPTKEALPACDIVGLNFIPAVGTSWGSLLAAKQNETWHDTQRARCSHTAEVDLNYPLLIVYTSGTTGYPKGAVHTQDAVQWNAINNLHLNSLTRHDHILTVLPLFHVGGFNVQTLPAFYCGATVTLHAGFDPEQTLTAISEEKPTITHLVPSMMRACIRSPLWDRTDFSSLHTLLTGTTIIPQDLCHAFQDKGVEVAELYGATETCPIAIYKQPHPPQDKATSIGLPAPHCTVRIVDENGHDQPTGKVGEILVKGPNVMIGYWRNEAATTKALRHDWYHTGDMGYQDSDGYYFINGRKKNLIIKGGENIYPAQVERVLNSHAEIQESAVVGIPDEQWQEIPLGVLVPKRDIKPSAMQMRTFLSDKLAEYKIPHHFIFIDALPKNAMKKVQHFQLRENLLQNETLMAQLTQSVREIHTLPDNFLQTVQQAAPLERYNLLIPALQSIMASVLGAKYLMEPSNDGQIETDWLDSQQSLLALGLDSVLAVGLRSRLIEIFDVEVPISFLIGPDTGHIASLADYLLANLPETTSHDSQAESDASSFQVERFLHELTIQGIELWPEGGNLQYAAPPDRITPNFINQLNMHELTLLDSLSDPIYAPLSEGQRRHWVIDQNTPDNSDNYLSFAYRIHSELDVALLRRTLQLMVNRHPSLRTRFIEQDERVVQQIDGYQKVMFEVVEATDSVPFGYWSEAYLSKQLQAFHERPFDLKAGPLFQVMVCHCPNQYHSMILSMHHIITDGWSINLLMDELCTLYTALKRGVMAQLPYLEHRYVDYVRWQQRFLETEGERLWSYWQRYLAGDLPVLQLQTDSSHSGQQDLGAISQKIHLSTILTKNLKQVAQEQGSTLYALLLTVYVDFLHHYSDQQDILVRLPTTGRNRPEFMDIIGYFVSPVMIRADLRDNPSFNQLLTQIKTDLLSVLDYQDYPLVRIIERLKPQDDISNPTLYQASFAFQLSHQTQDLYLQSDKHKQDELVLEPIPLRKNKGREGFLLELTLSETSAGIVGHLKGDTTLFTVQTLAHMSQYFKVLLEEVVAKSR